MITFEPRRHVIPQVLFANQSRWFKLVDSCSDCVVAERERNPARLTRLPKVHGDRLMYGWIDAGWPIICPVRPFITAGVHTVV